VPIASTGGESLMAVERQDRRYPRAVSARLFTNRRQSDRRSECGLEGQGRVDDVGTRTVFHNEGGTANSPKVYKVQVRPSPLAN
jgi:hypothetical protein